MLKIMTVKLLCASNISKRSLFTNAKLVFANSVQTMIGTMNYAKQDNRYFRFFLKVMPKIC